MSSAADPLPRFAGSVMLRRLAPSDLPIFQSYRNDPVIAKYQGWVAKSDAEATAFLIEMRDATLLQPGKWSQVGIAEPEGGLVGDLGLFVAADGRVAEIGFTLRRESQRAGKGTAAVRAAIGLLFEQTSVERVLGITDVRNLASIRLLQRVGMQLTQSRNVAFRGEPCVEHVYAISRPPT